EDTDSGGDRWSEPDRLADHRRIAVERGGPEPVGKYRHARRLRTIVVRVEQAAEYGAKAPHGEARAADHAGFHDPWFADETHHREVDRREITEGADAGHAGFEVGDFRHRERGVLGADAGRALADVNQA